MAKAGGMVTPGTRSFLGQDGEESEGEKVEKERNRNEKMV